ncbi:hypothetical protein EJB05_08397, partial [Eragrostis curvula]
MEAGCHRPTTRTVSTSTAKTAPATHTFRIVGYSLSTGHGEFIPSATFTVGGHKWCIRFFPDGDGPEFSKDYIAAYLHLVSVSSQVKVAYDLRLLNQITGVSSSVFPWPMTSLFTSSYPTWGHQQVLEPKQAGRDDCLIIECDITVVKELRVETTVKATEVEVPPSDMLDGLGARIGGSSRHHIQGEGEARARDAVVGLQGRFVRANEGERDDPNDRKHATGYFQVIAPLHLHGLVACYGGSYEDENIETVIHLVVAADRYDMERMKVMCESILAKRLHVDNVATTLALADQHHCSKLKDACIEFISSSNGMNDVLASKGYVHLKRAWTCLVCTLKKIPHSGMALRRPILDA